MKFECYLSDSLTLSSSEVSPRCVFLCYRGKAFDKKHMFTLGVTSNSVFQFGDSPEETGMEKVQSEQSLGHL